MQAFDELGFLDFEFLHDRPHQKSFCREHMTTAVKPAFDAILGNPQTFLGEKFSLDDGRTEITDLEHNFLFNKSGRIGVKIFKFFGITVKTAVDSSGEDNGGGQCTSGIT